MAQETTPSEGKVYDPLLGGERDAFPGEVIPPEQQKTLNRLMLEEETRFNQFFEPVVATGQLTDEQIRAIRLAAQIGKEIKRKEYVEAIKTNPANIIQGVLKELEPEKNPILKDALSELDKKIIELQNRTRSVKTSNQVKGNEVDTLTIVRQYGDRNLIYLRIPPDKVAIQNEQVPIAFEALRKLEVLPVESLSSFADLYFVVRESRNTPESGKPYIKRSTTYLNDFTVENLSSKRPGLEGITASFGVRTNGEIFVRAIRSFAIDSTPVTLARILDKGQYVPYSEQSR